MERVTIDMTVPSTANITPSTMVKLKLDVIYLIGLPPRPLPKGSSHLDTLDKSKGFSRHCTKCPRFPKRKEIFGPFGGQ